MNQPSQQWRVTKHRETSPLVLFSLSLFPAALAGIVTGILDHWSAPGILGAIVVFATAPTLAVVLTRFVQRRVRKELPFKYAVLVVVAAFGGAVAGLAQVHVAPVQRCIDTRTYDVVAPSYCDDTANSTDILPLYGWYYGGSGTQIGQTAVGGSFSSDGDDGGDTGGTGGDVGGDVGDDGGGGEGGGDG
jgi:hypothetical protein